MFWNNLLPNSTVPAVSGTIGGDEHNIAKAVGRVLKSIMKAKAPTNTRQTNQRGVLVLRQGSSRVQDCRLSE